MKTNLKTIFLLMLLLLVKTGAYAVESGIDTDMYSVCHISMKEGLSHNFVEDLFRDSKGFVWIATSGSLARHDGYEFVNFTPNSMTRHIKSSFVWKMTEDRFGRLWAASDGGIDVIDINSLSTIQIADKSGRLEDISSEPSGYISTDIDGNIWLRNPKNVVCISFDSEGEITGIYETPHHESSILWGSAVTPVGDRRKGVISVIKGKLCRLSLENGKIVSRVICKNLEIEPDTYVSDFIMKDDVMWISSETGLFCYDTKTGESRQYRNLPGVEVPCR